MLNYFRFLRNCTLTVATLVDELAPIHGTRPIAFHDSLLGLDGRPQPSLDFAGFHGEICALSRFLAKDLDLRRGERVAICKTNDARYFRWFLAVIRAGGVAMPINPLLTLRELRHVAAHGRPAVFVTDRAVFSRSIGALEAIPIRSWVQDDYDGPLLPGFRRVPASALSVPPGPPARLDPDDTVALFHTSGTQGLPKGVPMSSRALLGGRGIGMLVVPFIGKRELALFTLPWAHIFAISAALNGLIAGVPARFLDRFDPVTAIEAIHRDQITMFVGVPAMIIRMLNAEPPLEKLASVRFWVSASDHLPKPFRDRLLRYGALFRLFGRTILPSVFISAYGLVEFGGPALVNVSTRFLPGLEDCFVPVPPTQVCVADQKGRRVPPGRVGELLVRKPGMPQSYWGESADPSKPLTSEGWLHTGDLARRLRWGPVRLLGRSKDVIKTGGYSVYAGEVEEVLASHPAVAAAVVVGIPHPEIGEAPVAVLEFRDGTTGTEQELLSWLRERLAAYKVPRRIHVLPHGSIPTGATDKALKSVLKQRYADDFYATRTRPADERLLVSM